jgi:hypothetical protein
MPDRTVTQIHRVEFTRLLEDFGKSILALKELDLDDGGCVRRLRPKWSEDRINLFLMVYHAKDKPWGWERAELMRGDDRSYVCYTYATKISGRV